MLQELIQLGNSPALMLDRCPMNQNDFAGMRGCTEVCRGRGLLTKSTTTAPS